MVRDGLAMAGDAQAATLDFESHRIHSAFKQCELKPIIPIVPISRPKAEGARITNSPGTTWKRVD